jgi:putative tryptophan/tyrosine transport system substrate-binding protein
MRRREFIPCLVGAMGGWPFAASAQQSDGVRRIGVLTGVTPDDPAVQPRITAFLQVLQQLGWTDGGNVRIDYRWGAGDTGEIRKHADGRPRAGR